MLASLARLGTVSFATERSTCCPLQMVQPTFLEDPALNCIWCSNWQAFFQQLVAAPAAQKTCQLLHQISLCLWHPLLWLCCPFCCQLRSLWPRRLLERCWCDNGRHVQLVPRWHIGQHVQLVPRLHIPDGAGPNRDSQLHPVLERVVPDGYQHDVSWLVCAACGWDILLHDWVVSFCVEQQPGGIQGIHVRCSGRNLSIHHVL